MMSNDFTVDEIEGVIATIERSRKLWRGNEDYARKLDIELYALNLLRAMKIIEVRFSHEESEEEVSQDEQRGPGNAQEQETSGNRA